MLIKVLKGWILKLEKIIKEVVESWEIYCENGMSKSRPAVDIPRATDLNAVSTLDLKKYGKKYIFWMVCAISKIIKGMVIKDKKAEKVIQTVHKGWYMNFGYPSVAFYADNCCEFKNCKMEEFVSKMGLKIEFGPAFSFWSKGINERNHHSDEIVVKRY